MSNGRWTPHRSSRSSSSSRTFSPNRPSHGKDFLRSATRLDSHAIDLSRATSHARHATHDTSRDADAGRGFAQSLVFPVGGLRSAPFFTPNLQQDASRVGRIP